MIYNNITDHTNSAPLFCVGKTNEKIFWLHITIDDAMIMYIFKNVYQLNHQLGGGADRESVITFGIHGQQ